MISPPPIATTNTAPTLTTTVRTMGHPLLRLVAGIPVACFSGALIADIAYALTANIIWADFSAWLLAAGMAIGVLAVIAGLIELVAGRRRRAHGIGWPLALGSLVVLVLALLDNFVHSRDAWTSVVPEGLILSAATVAVMLATIWLDSARAGRQRVAYSYVGTSR